MSRQGGSGRTVVASRRPDQIAAVLGALVALIGAAVLVGWFGGFPRLTSLGPGWPAMRANAALGFILAGAALVLLGSSAGRGLGRRVVGRACAAVVALLGGLTLAEFGVGDLGIDQLLVDQPLDALDVDAPGRMAPVGAVGFVLLGAALLLGRSGRGFQLFQSLVLLGGLIGWLGLSHYFYGGEPLLPFAQLAAHAALAFSVLAIGLLCLRPHAGLVALLRSDGAGGLIARRLVPCALLVPMAFAWLRLEGQRRGWFAIDAGLSLFGLANVLVFGGLVWICAHVLERTDRARRAGELELEAQLARHQLLNHVTRAIGDRQDLGSIFRVVAASVEEDLSTDFACVCTRRDDAELVVETIGDTSHALAPLLGLAEKARVPIHANGLSRCLAGELVHEPDTRGLGLPLADRLAEHGLGSLVAAPLVVESQVFGVLLAARRGPGAFSTMDCEFLRQLGEHVALAIHGAEIHAALQQAYDDLRQSQQAALQQERLRALGQMASGIAHDINNAISPVALYAEALLEREAGLSPRGREHLQVIARAVDDVAATVGRMREFYRQREPELRLAPVQLGREVQQVLDLTRARWSDMPQRAGTVIDLRTDIDPDLPAILGVDSEIRDALTNLVLNAVDAMPDGGQLTVRARRGDARGAPIVLIEITDTGVGMDEETRRRCLEPFFTTKGPRGTGLGLAQVYGAARRHGAELDVTSERLRGTTVRLGFPVPAAPLAGPASSERPRVASPPLDLLVIDDDPLLLRSLRDSLEADGHRVTTAGSGAAGIEAFRSRQDQGAPFALVMTDLGMPHVDGRKVARAVKASSPATPVVLLTGWGQRFDDAGDAARATPAHVDRVLGKPPKLGELRAALADLCAPAAPSSSTSRPDVHAATTA